MINLPSESTQLKIPNHAFSVPISSIHSLIVRPPTFSSWHGTAVVNLFCGPTLPTLHFHDDESRSTQFNRQIRQSRLSQGQQLSSLPSSWGGEGLLNQLRRFADICPSIKDPGLFLLNPSQAERDDHSTPIFSGDAISPPNPSHRTSILHESLQNHRSPATMDNLTFSILNSFSRFTQNARSAAQMVLSHRLAKPIIPHLPKPIASLANGEPEFIKWSQQAGVEGYDSARVYLAKWASIVAAQGEQSRRAEIGDWDQDSSLDEDGGFEMIYATYKVPRVRSNRAPSQPIEPEEFEAWKDDSGRLMLEEAEGRRRIFQRGLSSGARKEVWMFLLRVYDWKSTAEERRSIRLAMNDDYKKLKEIWEKDDILKATAEYQEESHRIDIDCKRTDRRHPYFADPIIRRENQDGEDCDMDRANGHIETMGKVLTTYNIWEKELGYVQGMSDLCAPLYVVCEADEVLTFFAFVKLMDRMKSHFLRDQSGMKDKLSRLQQLLLLIDPQLYHHFEKTNSLNLFFCFRWILIAFKREFEFDDVLKVWEALWTEVFGPHSDLFFAISILEAHREPMIRYLREFDEVLKYVNDISMTLDCEQLIGQAEVLYLTFKSILETRLKVNEEGQEVIENERRSIKINEQIKSLI
ncbi:rab-GTPase-TBC domain-containing protein [Phakopsora pachyrhizi]|nr:rab-GTPase-TBC domain-containing protein [Phakopsora pachyrhizi]